MLKFLQSEPVAVSGFVSTVLALVLAFGVHVTTGQIGATLAAVNAFLALLVRGGVTPNVKVPPTPPVQ
jgi:hypothetical protein